MIVLEVLEKLWCSSRPQLNPKSFLAQLLLEAENEIRTHITWLTLILSGILSLRVTSSEKPDLTN